jgi:hypothetical protein
MLLEGLQFDIELIESVVAEIKNWYDSTRKTLSDSQAQLEKKSNVCEYDNELDYKFYLLDRTVRVMYASVAVALSAVAENFLYSLCIEMGLIKIEVPEPNKKPNERVIKDCAGNEIKERDLKWGRYEKLIKQHKKM